MARDPAAAGRVAGSVEIYDVRLRSSLFLLERPFAPEELASYHTEYRADVVELNKDRLQVAVSFGLRFHSADEPPEEDHATIAEQPLKVFVDYLVDYAVTGTGIDPDDAESFAHFNAVFNAWAYWRQLVHATLPSMGLGQLVIPMFRVPISAGTTAAPRKRTRAAGKTGASPKAGSGGASRASAKGTGPG